jgi:hypothetical protein
MLMSTMEIPLLQPLPQPPALTYTAPSLCRDTEHAVAAALCLAGSDSVFLESHLTLLLHRSNGIVPHASYFITRHPVAADTEGLKDVILAGSPAAAKNDFSGEEAVAFGNEEFGHREADNGISGTSRQVLESERAALVAKQSKTLLNKKRMMVARKLQSAVASQRRKIVMINGLSWGERVCLLQFCEGRLVDAPFTARVLHSCRVIGCFVIGENVCTVDSQGWIKWFACPFYFVFSVLFPNSWVQAQRRHSQSLVCARSAAGCCGSLHHSVCAASSVDRTFVCLIYPQMHRHIR